MGNKGKVIIGIILALVILGLIGSCSEDSEYEKAGKEFSSWINKNPNSWSDTQKKYFNNFMEWSDKN